MTPIELQTFFEQHDFRVHLFKQDNKQCAEVESWTSRGVNMIMSLMPFTEESFKEYVHNFDVDEEIDLHRQGDDYKQAFSIRESVADFEAFEERLKKLEKLLSS